MTDECPQDMLQLQRELQEAKRRIKELAQERSGICFHAASTEDFFDWIDTPLACLRHENGEFFYVRVNKAFADCAGQDAAQLENQNHFSMFPDAELKTLFEKIMAEGQQVRKRAWPLQRPGGGETFWDLSLLPRNNAQGPGSLLVLNMVEVTEHVRTKKALSEREQSLRALINAVPDIVCFKDGQGRWLEANDADLELFGLSGVDYRGKTDAQLANDTLPIFREAFLTCEQTDEKAWQGGVVSHVEETIPLAEGGCKTFDVIKVPLFHEDGSRKGLVVMGRDITQRKLAEEALQESEARHTLVLQGANDGIWDWDRKTDKVFFSKRWKEIIGYQDAEIGNDISEWRSRIHPEDREKVMEANDRFFNSSDTHFEVEYRIKHKDGSYRWVLGRGTCLRDEHGLPHRMAGTHTDITKLKRVEEQLRRSVEHFRAMFDNAIMGIALHELLYDEKGNACDYRIRNVNDSYCRILEVAREDVEGGLASAVYKLEEAPLLETFDRVVRTGEPAPFETFYSPLQKHFRVIAFATGESSFATMFEDVTEAKRAEEQLHEALSRLSFHVDNSPLAVIEWKDGTHIGSWSSRAESMFGWTAEEVLGKNWNDFTFVHPEDVKTVEAEIMRLFRGQDVFNTSKNRNLCKDGSVLHCNWFNSALRDESGRMISILSQVADVTELVETARQLREAKEAAEAASMAKSQFLATMSHEIRTPMNVIVGMAELFRDTPLNREQKQHLQIFDAASESLLTLLGDILDITKVEAGQLQLDTVSFRPAGVLETVTRVLGPRAAEKGLELTLEQDAEIPEFLTGDPNRLRQVFVNLVSNAIKFTPGGEVRIRVEVDRSRLPELSQGAFPLRCSVSDTGIGIKDQNLERIFEQFAQGDSSITREYGGAGLGLAICKNLVELMQGRLWVESSEGQGSIFYFTAVFGLHETRQEEESPEAKLQSLENTLGTPSEEVLHGEQPLRVLLVEDSDYNAYVVLAYLKHANCVIDIAKNGRKGLEQFMSQPYDLVLMDIRMPVMDGLSATQAIRRFETEHELQPTPIVAMTAHAFAEDVRRSLDAGCDLHLSKPVSKRELLRIIHTLTPAGPRTIDPQQSNEGETQAKEDPDAVLYPLQGPIEVAPDPELAHVVDSYLQSLGVAIRKARSLLEQGDLQSVGQIGHHMKGEGQAFGFAPVSVLGAALQNSCQAGDVAQTLATLEKLEDYLARVVLAEGPG